MQRRLPLPASPTPNALTPSTLLWAVFLMVALAGCGQESATHLGVLTEFLDEGQDGVWAGSFEGDGYWLENAEDAGAIRYYYGSYNSQDDGSRKISVDVTIADAAADSRAGLVYGYDQRGNYYLVMLGSAGEVSTFRRDENGVREVMSSTRQSSAATQTLAIRESGAEIEILVNGESMGSMQSPGTGQGAVGIAAMGIGRFGFNNYRSNESVPLAIPASTSNEKVVTSDPQADASSQSDQPKEMTRRIIKDEFGFERPIDAYAIELPADWSLKGSVQWHGVAECPLELAKVHFMATAPGGSERIESIPGGSWAWMSIYDSVPHMQQQVSTGCPNRRILDMPSFMQAYIPSIRPNAEQISTRARPDLAQQILESAGGMSDPYRQIDIQVQEVEIRYEADNKTINELLISTVLFSQAPGADPYGGMSGIVFMAQGMGTMSIANVNAPPNRELLETVGNSMIMLPDYQKRLQQFVDQRSQMMAQAYQRRRAAQQQYLASRRAAAAARSNYKVDTTGSDILDIQFKGWQSRDNMTSAGQSRAVDGIHDRTAFNNAQGQVVYMPTSHSRMYQLPNDVYVGTNDQFFNPVQATGEFGQELGEHQYGW